MSSASSTVGTISIACAYCVRTSPLAWVRWLGWPLLALIGLWLLFTQRREWIESASTPGNTADWLRYVQNAVGAILSPFDSWLVLRGTKTLALRMPQHEANARRMAAFVRESRRGCKYTRA